MIFAAGLGTRLRPLTADRPKALVEVAGVTMLERVINHVKEAGVTDITVNVHHFAQMIVDFIASHNNFGVNIHVSDERELLLDTGGGILAARRWLDGDEPILVHNADILTTVDVKEMASAHNNSGAISTILVKARETQRYFLFDDDNTLKGWINKSTGQTRPNSLHYQESDGLRELAFGGVHVISPAIFPALERYAMKDKVFSITSFYIDNCTSMPIKAFVPDKDYTWLDVGKPETLEMANRLFASNNNL